MSITIETDGYVITKPFTSIEIINDTLTIDGETLGSMEGITIKIEDDETIPSEEF